jgi:peptidoglycan L-alanyl-D-glutamate endopeptidase CwlK
MTFALGQRSMDRLAGVHPELVKVVVGAIALSTVDFSVVEGVRPKSEMWANYGKGRTAAECVAKGVPASCAQPALAKVTWLNDPLKSKHGVQADGLGHAVDLAPFVNGAIDWNTRAHFISIRDAMMAAATAEGVALVWGGQWLSSPDLPHFEWNGIANSPKT